MTGNLYRLVKGLSALLRLRPLLTLSFLITLTFTIIFALKAIVHFFYWTENRQQNIEPWMSASYVARIWLIDTDEIRKTLELDNKALMSIPIARLAQIKGKPPTAIIDKLGALVKSEHGDPPS